MKPVISVTNGAVANMSERQLFELLEEIDNLRAEVDLSHERITELEAAIDKDSFDKFLVDQLKDPEFAEQYAAAIMKENVYKELFVKSEKDLKETKLKILHFEDEIVSLRMQKYIPVHDTFTDAGKEYYEKCILLEKELARRDEQIAELTATTHSQTLRNAELSRFVWWVFHVYARNVQELTSGITEACTYETEEKAEKGKYGLPIRCWKYVRYLEEYTAGIYNGTYLDSETSTGVKDPPAGHWKGCEEVHWDCRIAQLEKEIERLTAELGEVLKAFDDAQAEVARRDEIITRLKEDAERLAERPHPFTDVEHIESGTYCHYCHKSYKFEHDDNCPITLHRALMKGLE